MKVCPRCGNAYPDDIAACLIDKAELVLPEDPFVGKIIGGCYRITSRIAHGGMSSIYRAEHVYFRRELAVKILKPTVRGDEESRRRMIREAKISLSIVHPNIVTVYDLLPVEGSVCMVMELIDGPTLGALLEKEGRLPVRRALGIVSMTADALGRAHSLGVVHRDIKPGNIFITRQGAVDDFVKLVDFGIAYTVGESRLTQDGMMVGTPAYASPEQIRGKAPGKTSDIYSLGCVVYELLTGRTPFASRRIDDVIKGHLFNAPEPLRASRPDVTTDLERIILRMLEKDPERRHQDAYALIYDLKSTGAGYFVGAAREQAPRTTEPPPEAAAAAPGPAEWSAYLQEVSREAGAAVTGTAHYRAVAQAAGELQAIERRAKEIVEEMERLETRTRRYKDNIGSAIETLGMDLSRLRSELEKSRMEYVAVLSEAEHVEGKLRESVDRVVARAGARGTGMQVGDEETALLIEAGNLAMKLNYLRNNEKGAGRARGEQKGQIEDLKFQIAQLTKRLRQIEAEHETRYDECRATLDETSQRRERLRQEAAAAACRIDTGGGRQA